MAAQWFEVMRYAAPVGIAALGETVGQRAGVLNIGLEGMMLSAAYAAMTVSQSTSSPWAGLIAGIGVGACLSALQLLFTLQLKADQVVVGTALNFAALGGTSTLFRASFGQSGALLSVPSIPAWAPGLDGGTITMLLAALALTLVLWRTRWGLALRAAGEAPKAVDAAGFSTRRVRTEASLVAGAFAGLAGAYLAVGVAGSFVENMTSGRGFVAIAMVTFGRWRPIGVVLASLVVGVAEQAQFELQARNVGLPHQLFVAMPYLLALALLVAIGRGPGAPAALGRAA